MVSKGIKRTPTKPTKDRRSSSGCRRKTPLKSVAKASAIVVSSINRSIYTCRRRLLKIFTKLTIIGTPKRRKDGFRLLKKAFGEKGPAPACPIPQKPLPPSAYPEKKTVFLDLDETLIHSKADPPPEKYDFVVRPMIDGEILNFYVLKRPGVDKLLEEISKSFEIVVFTAGLEEYASLVLDRLDPKGMISHRLYRDSCKEMEGKFIKDLSELGRDLKRAVIVDDNPNAYVFQPGNAVRVNPFIDDLGDQELERVMKFLEIADCFEDMRDAVAYYLSEGES
ncbi:uncharacterized protein LOC131245444 [Magnolia sinica]|uniref:uncharacterized protein LOC131245444 n=1 Tax=Magnolia sinica TaxID=86752 RepID=UPI00265B2ED4|nr:uncharacterized protein LOC131245444 [Magnolia sinica]